MEIFFKVVLTSEKHFLRYRRERDFYYLESESESRSVLSDCLRPHGLYSSWKPTRQNTGVHFLNAKFIRNWDHLGSNDHLSEMKDKDYAK